MKKLLSTLSIAVLALTGCSTTQATNENAGACENAEAKIGFVTDIGGINDKSFNQGTWEGIEDYCASSGIGATYIETTDSSQVNTNLTQMSETEGIEVVVGSGYTFAADMYDVAKSHPDVDYVLIDAEPTNPETNSVEPLDNVTSYLFKEQEAGFLVGYIAGKSTQTNRVGFIGGQEIPPVQKFGWGYVQGVNAANPQATVDYQYAGTFEDATVGNTIAETMISQGSDIIFSSAGATNDGIVKAAIDHRTAGEEISVIGVDRDMFDDGIYEGTPGSEDAKSVILTSAVKKVGTAAKEGIASHFDGNFAGAKTTVLGLSDGGVGVPEVNPNLEDAVVTEAKDALANFGEVSVDKEEIASKLEITINGNL